MATYLENLCIFCSLYIYIIFAYPWKFAIRGGEPPPPVAPPLAHARPHNADPTRPTPMRENARVGFSVENGEERATRTRSRRRSGTRTRPTDGQAPCPPRARRRCATTRCWSPAYTHARTHARARARTHARTRTRTHAHAHAHARARTHTRTLAPWRRRRALYVIILYYHHYFIMT